MTLGDPLASGRLGAGLRVTELVCEMRWLRLGKVSEAPARAAAAATEGERRGQAPGPGERGTWGLVGVIRWGRGVRGEEGGNEVGGWVSLIRPCRMLWITSPAPEHLSAKSVLESKHRAFPKHK